MAGLGGMGGMGGGMPPMGGGMPPMGGGAAAAGGDPLANLPANMRNQIPPGMEGMARQMMNDP